MGEEQKCVEIIKNKIVVKAKNNAEFSLIHFCSSVICNDKTIVYVGDKQVAYEYAFIDNNLRYPMDMRINSILYHGMEETSRNIAIYEDLKILWDWLHSKNTKLTFVVDSDIN
jgi:hypothetical protein